MLTDTPHIVDEASVIRRVSALTLGGLSGGDQCPCCGAGPFHTRAQQTAHYKHHWQCSQCNVMQAMSLAEFNARQDDNSSVSGGDSEVEDTGSTDLFAAATRHCKAFFRILLVKYSVYTAAFYIIKKDYPSSFTWLQLPISPKTNSLNGDSCLFLKFNGGCGWESLMKSVTLGNVTMSHRTRGPPVPCVSPLNYDRSAAR
ncbi:hypothetical protein EVAR_63137_1 [Eumeta japonica]|uniref:Uncharacterized protein n=1 Tax=Eumeta variegata TaxID=151549 RepID=A0A4C1ST81_EUMVA|nr:hypothetical protein EVAR_63137_1 [Eumeta japonica]